MTLVPLPTWVKVGFPRPQAPRRLLETDRGLFRQADSYHIYGRDIAQAKAMLFDRLDSMALEERTFNFGDDFIRDMYDQAEQAALLKIRKYDEEHAEL